MRRYSALPAVRPGTVGGGRRRDGPVRARLLVLLTGVVALAASLVMAETGGYLVFFGGDGPGRGYVTRSWFERAFFWIGLLCVAAFLLDLVLNPASRPPGADAPAAGRVDAPDDAGG